MLYVVVNLIVVYVHIVVFLLFTQAPIEYISESNVFHVKKGGKTVAKYRKQSRNHRIFSFLYSEGGMVSFQQLSEVAKVDEDMIYSSLKNLRLNGDLLTISRKGKWAQLDV